MYLQIILRSNNHFFTEILHCIKEVIVEDLLINITHFVINMVKDIEIEIIYWAIISVGINLIAWVGIIPVEIVLVEMAC